MLPLLTVILFAGIEGGYFMWTEHKVVKAVRDGARFAGRQPFSSVHCGSGVIDGAAQIKSITRTGDPSGTVPVVQGWVDSDTTVTLSCDSTTTTGIYEELPDGAPRITVSAYVAYPSLFGAIGFPTSGLHITAKAQAAVMGL